MHYILLHALQTITFGYMYYIHYILLHAITCNYTNQSCNSLLLRPFHRPGVDIPQPAAVSLISSRITLSSWIIRPLVPGPSHAERNSASVTRTDHGYLAQYGCDGTHEEAGSGHQLVEPASLSLPHPVVRLWIWGIVRLQLGQEGALYADRSHDIGADNNGEEE